MSLRAKIQSQMIAAMKARQQARVDALRFLFSNIKNKEIDAHHELTDEEITKLFQTEAKRRREAIEAYQKGGRKDLVDKEKNDLSIIEEFLPKQLTDEELKAIIADVKSQNPVGDFGTLMRAVLAKTAGLADGARVARMLQQGA